MDTIRVLPTTDGVDMRESWKVEVNGRRISTHTKKSAAKRTARDKADDGDHIVVHDTGGQFDDTNRVRDASPDADSERMRSAGTELDRELDDSLDFLDDL